jgi:putative transposase
MLTPDELATLCQRLALSEQAQKVLTHIRSSPPSRRVGSDGKNVPVRYPSRKMGVVIQAESRTVEFAGVYLMEHDPLVLEFWDQPNPPINLHYPVKQKNGRTRNVGVLHTPDYFVIRKKPLEKPSEHEEWKIELGWEEYKTEEELRRFESEESHRYVRDEHGQWRCPPGEAVAAPLGFYYRVRSSAEIHEVFQRNLRFLSYYLREESLHVSEHAQMELLALIKQEPGIPLSALLEQIRVATSDDIYTLLAQDALYTDIYAAPLAEPERVHIFSDEVTASTWSIVLEQRTHLGMNRPHTILVEPGAPVVWDGRPCTILYEGQTTITLLTDDQQPVELSHSHFHALIATGKLMGHEAGSTQGSLSQQVRERLLQANKAALKEAKRRYSIIEPVLHGERLVNCPIPARTVRDWVTKYRDAEQALSCGYVGLLPKVQERGNRKPHLDEKAVEYLTTFIDKEYENHKQKNKREVYGEFENYCKNKGLISVPSYKTFVAAVNRRPRYEQVKKRKGARAAYPREPMYWELSYNLPRHGDRPFEVVHIDHTLLDVELVDSQTMHQFGKPWATFLTDAFSRRLLAVYLTFDEPSYKSCMMILRECVHHYHRFPELVVVDWGPEFESIYFETLLARYECSKASRPKAKPRFGSVIERLFNTANTTFIHNLSGNTQIMKHVRQVTKSVNPREHAVWTLGALYAALRCWAYEVYDTIEHGTLKQTPKEVFETGLLRSGARPKQWIEYDDDFLQLTLPSTRKGTAKLVPGKGVKVNNIFYWARGEVFLDHPELEKKQIPIRYDPYDMGHVYVSIPGHRQPVECISEHYAQLKGHSERELQIATEELRARDRHHSQQFSVTAAKLANFITSVEAQEALLAQRKRDYEARAIFALMEGRQASVGELPTPQRVIHGVQQPEPASATLPSISTRTALDGSEDSDIYEDF